MKCLTPSCVTHRPMSDEQWTSSVSRPVISDEESSLEPVATADIIRLAALTDRNVLFDHRARRLLITKCACAHEQQFRAYNYYTYTYHGFRAAMASPRSLFVRIQYPQSVGPLSEDRLDTFLHSMQKVSWLSGP